MTTADARYLPGEDDLQGPFTVGEMQAMARSGRIDSTTLVRRETGGWLSAMDVPGVFSTRDWMLALYRHRRCRGSAPPSVEIGRESRRSGRRCCAQLGNPV